MSNNVQQILTTTAFGELSIAQPTPVSQIAANYGISDKTFLFTSGTGSSSSADSLFIADTGGTSDSLSVILTKRHMLYRPGQGAMTRFTAIYDTPAAGSQQYAGFITSTDSFAIGYNGTEFGVLHAHNGVTELQELTITSPAGGSENATITIGGTPYVVPLTSGTIQHNAYEIAVSLTSQNQAYSFTSNEDTVVAVSIDAAPVGSFAFVSNTSVASWAQLAAGSLPVEEWTIQSSWNQNTFPSLDTTKGNVFQVTMQYLGFGAIEFSAEDPETGGFVLLHRIEYANKNTTPSITNPTLRSGWLTRNTTNSTSIKIKGASVGTFNEGNVVITEDPRGLSNTQVGVGSAQTNVLTIRNRTTFGDIRNRAEHIPLSISAFTDGTKGAILELRKNADITGDLNYSYVNKGQSIIEVATDGGAVTGGEVLSVASVTTSGFPIDLTKFGIRLFPNETLTISMAAVSGPNVDMTAAIVGVEDL